MGREGKGRVEARWRGGKGREAKGREGYHVNLFNMTTGNVSGGKMGVRRESYSPQLDAGRGRAPGERDGRKKGVRAATGSVLDERGRSGVRGGKDGSLAECWDGMAGWREGSERRGEGRAAASPVFGG